MANLEIAEMCARSGANCGSLFLDLRFRELVKVSFLQHNAFLVLIYGCSLFWRITLLISIRHRWHTSVSSVVAILDETEKLKALSTSALVQ